MSENASLKIWRTLQPMVRKEITKGTESSIKSKKMVVTTAFNASTKTVGVTEAFGTEIQVPVSGVINPNSLTVGTAVWVIALHGNWSNAIVWMLGDGTVGSINAETFGGKLPNQYLSVSGTAANAQKLGGKAPEYYLPAENLLINSYFVNPVNQREQTTYSGAAYSIDCWKSFSNGTVVTVENNGINFAGESFAQLVPVSLMKNGQKYTFAAKQLDGTIRIATGMYPMNVAVVQNGVTIKLDGLTTQYVAITTAGTYEWAALYEGEYTAETIPPYLPKGYSQELSECQRYFVRIGGNAYTPIGLAYAQNTTQLICMVDLPQVMRQGVVPSVNKGGDQNMTAKCGNIFKNISSVALSMNGVGTCALALTTDSVTAGDVFDVYVPTGSWLDVSVEL